MATERRAEVTWRGDLLSGAGTIERVGSGAFGPLDVTWASRAEGARRAHEPGGADRCGARGVPRHGVVPRARSGRHPAEELSISATVTFVPGTGIASSALEVEGRVAGIDDAAFEAAVEAARDGCPVSQALKGNVELSATARFVES